MANYSAPIFIAAFVFGIFGWFIFRHGKSETNARRMLLGLALMTYGILVPNPYLNWSIGLGLLAINYYSPWMKRL